MIQILPENRLIRLSRHFIKTAVKKPKVLSWVSFSLHHFGLGDSLKIKGLKVKEAQLTFVAPGWVTCLHLGTTSDFPLFTAFQALWMCPCCFAEHTPPPPPRKTKLSKKCCMLSQGWANFTIMESDSLLLGKKINWKLFYSWNKPSSQNNVLHASQISTIPVESCR